MKDVYGIIMTDDEAIACLRHFHWNDTKLSDRWFEDQDQVKHEVGL